MPQCVIDLIAWTKKAIAAENLAAASVGDTEKIREFAKISSDQKNAVLDAIRKVNYAFVQVHKTGASPADAEYSLEPIQVLSKDGVLQHLSRNLFPSAFFAEHMQSRSSELIGRKVSAIESEYRNTLGYPIIVYLNEFQRAVQNLVSDGVFNLAHPAGTQHAGETPHLRDQDLMDATIAAPSARPATVAKTAPATEDAFSLDQTPLAPTASPVPYTPPSQTPEMQVNTGFCESRQQLRQQVAARLEQADGRSVTRVRIGMTFETRHAEMSTLPAFLRGSLGGNGTFNGEVTLEFIGPFTKAALEEMMERLPDFSPGSAKVTLFLGA